MTGVALAKRARELERLRPAAGRGEVEKILRSAEQWPTGDALFLGHHCTDSGNAERLIDYCGERVRYCAADSAWYIYDGLRWAQDKTLRIEDLAGEALRGIYDEAGAGERPRRAQEARPSGPWPARRSPSAARPSRSPAATGASPCEPATSTATAGCSTA